MFQSSSFNQPASSAGSLFSSTSNTQPAKRGLFDTPASTQPARPSPFGGQATTATLGAGFGGQPNTGTSSIYSANATGNAPAPSAQPALGASIFGQPQAQGTQTQQNQQQQAPLNVGQSVLSTQSTQPAFFSSLLERGKKRPHPSNVNAAPVELPNLQLGLDDIRRTARGLGGREAGAAAGPGADTRAHYSLTASGISPGQVLHDLRTLDTQAPAISTSREDEAFDPDNQKFLRRIQQRGREAMIAESLARVRRDFDAFLEEKVNLNWDEQRQKIFEHFGLAPKSDDADSRFDTSTRDRGAFGASKSKFDAESGRPGASSRRSVFGRSGLAKSVIGSTIGGANTSQIFSQAQSTAQSTDSRFVREKIGHFAGKVQHLNEARLQERTFPILHEFSEVEKSAITDAPRQLFEAYQALINITSESNSIVDFSEPGAIRERQFAEDYLDDAIHSPGSIRMRRRLIEGTRKYLENAFYREVENAVAKNPREAQLGGVPTITNKIRAYIRLRAVRKDLAPDGTELQMVDQDYCWVLIFYLLRCGFVSEAAEYVSRNQGFRSMDYKFVTYMTTYAQQRRLPRDLQQKINGEYQQRLRNAPENTVDPYRMACYKIIGRCDISSRRLEGMHQGVEDWMWLQFTLAREDNRAEEVAGEVFGLLEIQNDITEIGQRIFAKGAAETAGGYGTFFLLQILGGMFEQAISYLGSYAPVNAVHFAIALDYYGLLRVSDFYTSGEELLSFTTKQLPQINFAYLITQYTREFRTGNVEAAVDYFTLICLNADLPGELGKSQASVCHEALREFILETRDFAKLLGDIKSDGTRIKGAIEQRLKLIKLVDQDEFLKTITTQAAAVADDKGLTADAVLLYHLSEEYDNAVAILNRALSDAVAIGLGDSPLKLQPLKPRTDASQAPEQQAPLADVGSSLSLTSAEDPVELAKNMIGLYNTNAMYYQRIYQLNRESCGLLLRMMDAKSNVEAGKWSQALDDINNLQILPLRAQGSVTYVRSAAQSFSSLPAVIARNGGHLIMWSITCISRERDRLQQGLYENDMRRSLADELLVMAKDLMVFAGMIKYKLPPGVYEALAKAAGDMAVL